MRSNIRRFFYAAVPVLWVILSLCVCAVFLKFPISMAFGILIIAETVLFFIAALLVGDIVRERWRSYRTLEVRDGR